MKDVNGVKLEVGQRVLYANSERGFVKGRVVRIVTSMLPQHDGPIRERVTISTTEERYPRLFPASKGERVLVLA